MLLGGLPVALIHTEDTLHPGVSITDNEVGGCKYYRTCTLFTCGTCVHVYKCGELPSAPGPYEPPRVENM